MGTIPFTLTRHDRKHYSVWYGSLQMRGWELGVSCGCSMRKNAEPVYDASAMTSWLTLEQALGASGLRVAPVRAGVPSPWSEFIQACLHVKGIPYSLVDARDADRSFTSVKTLTGQESLPVVFWNDERPRSNWLEQLVLVERICLEPRLLPDDPFDRARVVGLIAELCSEAGFGWHRRVMMIERLLTEPSFGERGRGIGQYLSKKYRHTTDSVEASKSRCETIIRAFAGLRAPGAEYLLGSTLTALDLAWTAFAALIQPLPEDLCPMKPMWRDLYTWVPSMTPAHTVEALLSHRARIYRGLLPLPVDLG
jgi:glutathione S-transferase